MALADILDNEQQIETYLRSIELTHDGAPMDHFRFADSKSEQGIQLSDPIAGLLGKLFTYLNQTTVDEIADDLARMGDRQRWRQESATGFLAWQRSVREPTT